MGIERGGSRPGERLSRSRVATLGLLLAIAVLLIGTALQRADSAWLAVTLPTTPATVRNTVGGYAAIGPHGLIHLENVSTFKQLGMFSGVVVVPDLYFLRPAYTWLASLLLVAVPALTAVQVLNALCWWAALVIALSYLWHVGVGPIGLTTAALLILGGSGWLVHVADYSAHAFSFTVLAAGTASLWRLSRDSGEFRVRRRLLHGLALGLGAVAYSTSLYLLPAYVLLTWRRGRPALLALTLVTAAAVSAC